jgi:hypothetical protein
MRHVRRWLVASLGCLAIAIPLAVVGPTSAASAAARSTTVKLENNSGCPLFRTGYNLNHGEWGKDQPPTIVAPGTTAQWSSESNGFLTGTEGDAEFMTLFCDIQFANVRVYWDNPYFGANRYNYDKTDPRFLAPWDGGGGNNTTVTFHLSRRS